MPEIERRSIALTGVRTLPNGRLVRVYVDIDDAMFDAWLATHPGGWTWPLLPLAVGTMSLRVVDLTQAEVDHDRRMKTMQGYPSRIAPVLDALVESQLHPSGWLPVGEACGLPGCATCASSARQ